MQFSLELKTASLSVGEFAGFTLGPRESDGGPHGLWRAQLGQHWHNELRARTQAELPGSQFELVIAGRLMHRGWTIALNGRIDQLAGSTLREIKTVMRPLPTAEETLRADYPAYFLQLATYIALLRASPAAQRPFALEPAGARAELVFVETGSGLAQTITLTPFDEALVHHQLDALVEFLDLQLRATARRRALDFHSPYPSLRPGQETIQADLAAAFGDAESREPNVEGQGFLPSTLDPRPSTILLFEAPTGYGKTGCVLEFALGQLRAGRFARLIWLTGKSTGQIQVMSTLRTMTSGDAAWQIRNKGEHCVNVTFHCVRDACTYLDGGAERWPQSGLAKFYLDDAQPRDLESLRIAGRDARICPYEITRTSLAFHDIWIGDFNYVFAPSNRGLLFDQPGFDPAETLLVVDEAHNLPSRVAGAYSHRATESEARALLAELDHLRAPPPLVLAVEEWARLLASLQPVDALDPTVEAEVHDLLARLSDFVGTAPLDYEALGPKNSEALWQMVTLHNWMDGRDEDRGSAALATPAQKKQLTRLLWVARAGELEFTCVDAAPAIGETLSAFDGAILMSATLQPYGEFAASCGLDTPRPAGHPSPEGIPESPLSRGVARSDGVCFLNAPTPWRAGAYDIAVDLRVDTSFRQRQHHYRTTAATIEALQREAERGSLNAERFSSGPPPSALSAPPPPARCVAVFFPSYAYAEAVHRTLEETGSVLRVALQPRLPDLAAQTAWVEESLALADALFLVLGSSFAEGIDLLGGRVTHAMVVGPALPEVNAVQKAKLDALAGLGRDTAFRRVYQIPGLQKVNQALGRLVRAPGQKAKVLLHCRRFADPSYSRLLAADYQFYREIADETDLGNWLGR